MAKKKLKKKLTDVCCERFYEYYQSGEILYAYEKHSDIDETEWYINGLAHLYYCPFCGALIKGRGFGNYEDKHQSVKCSDVKIPRQNSLVKLDFNRLEKRHQADMPFTKKGVYVFFGEIPNMPGHCIVADHKSGQIYSGFHTEYFVELNEDEV